MQYPTLNDTSLKQAANELAEKIPEFKKILDKFGVPPLWDRTPGFSTLLYIVLEQQVSLASAKATFEKLQSRLRDITPKSFMTLDDKQLKAIGFSRQKTRYGRIIAQEILNRNLDLELFSAQKEQEVKENLMSITGIGHWTSDIYLLMVLLRPDIWPHGDRALAVSAYEVFSLNDIPSYDNLIVMSEKWKPWRSTAARLLWHNYLSTPRKK